MTSCKDLQTIDHKFDPKYGHAKYLNKYALTENISTYPFLPIK
jgi:hypothetical protein